MTHQVVGYIRVSSATQNIARQLEGIKLDKEFVEHATGSNMERKELAACMEYIRQGDLLVIDSIDRLARNLRDLQELVNTILQNGVKVRFIKENLLFTSDSDPVSLLTLHIIGSLAEFERDMIRSRQREGIDAAKKAGKHLGRPKTITKKLKEKVLKLQSEGMSIRKIANNLKVSRTSIYKALDLM